MDETTATLAGVFPSEPYANPVLSVEEDVELAPSTAFGIAPVSAGFQAVGLGPPVVAGPAATILGSAIVSVPVHQVFPSFQGTKMPGGVMAGAVVPFAERHDTVGGLGGIAGSGIGPLPLDEEEDLLPPPRPSLPFPLDDGKQVVTAATVGKPFENLSGSAEFASPRKEERFVAPDDAFLGFPRVRERLLLGIEIAPHAGYFCFGGMDFGPNAGLGSDGVPRYHDGFDQYGTLPPPLEPDCMCATALQTGDLIQPRPSALRIFEGEERALALGRGAGFAPDSISDVVGGVPPAFEAEAPLSPVQQEVNAGAMVLPSEPLSKGAKMVLESLLNQGGGGLAAGAVPGLSAAGPGPGAAMVAGSFGGARAGGAGPAGAAALQEAAAAAGGFGGGGGGGLVGQSAAARVERADAHEAHSKAQQRLEAAQAKADMASSDLKTAQTKDMEVRAAQVKLTEAERQKTVADSERTKARKDSPEEFETAQHKYVDAVAKVEAAKRELSKEDKGKIDKAREELDRTNEESKKADIELAMAKKEAAAPEARYEQTKAEVERLDDIAAHTEPSYGRYLDRVGDAFRRYRQYKDDAKRRLDAHDAKMSAGIGSGTKDEEKRNAAIAVARDARMRGQAAREGRDAATSASACLTQLRGYISPEKAAAVKAAMMKLKDLSAKEEEAAKKDRKASRYGPPSHPKDPAKEKQAKEEAEKAMMDAMKSLADALAKADEEAAATKAEKDKKKGKKPKESKKPHKYSGDWPDCDPAGCKCPGDCGKGKKGKKCVRCRWIPWPPPGEKGRGVGPPPSLIGLMPADTGMCGLIGFPFYAMAQEGPKRPAPPAKGEEPKPPASEGGETSKPGQPTDEEKEMDKRLEEAKKKREKDIRDGVDKEAKERNWDDKKREEEYKKRLKEYCEENTRRLQGWFSMNRVYAKADPGRRTNEATIVHDPPYYTLPLELQVIVDSHEEIHLADYQPAGALHDVVSELREANQALDDAKEEKKRAGKVGDKDAILAATRAIAKASAREQNAETAFEAQFDATECSAYGNTYRVLKRNGKCYRYVSDWLREVAKLIKKNCSKEDAKKILGADYDKQ